MVSIDEHVFSELLEEEKKAEEMILEARKKAEEIVRRAEEKARRIIEEAENSREYEEIKRRELEKLNDLLKKLEESEEKRIREVEACARKYMGKAVEQVVKVILYGEIGG